MKATIIILSSLLIYLIGYIGIHSHKPHGEFHPYFTSHECNGHKFHIDHSLVTYFSEFQKDAEKYNFDYSHIYCIQGIKVGHSDEWQGITSCHDIKINKHLQKDTIGMKFVFYHELGHWFGLNHGDEKTIMKENYSTEYDLEFVKDNWDYLVEDYFEKLKHNENL